MQAHVLDSVPDDDPRLVDIPTAAARLGLSVDGVRKRVQRHQLTSVKRDGRVYVVLDGDQDTDRDSAGPTPIGAAEAVPPPSSTATSTTALAESLAAQLARADTEIAFLRAELERKDAIIMRLVEQRALPAPVPSNGLDNDRDTSSTPSQPWWRRWLQWRQTPHG
jgi:hypothetical protein